MLCNLSFSKGSTLWVFITELNISSAFIHEFIGGHGVKWLLQAVLALAMLRQSLIQTASHLPWVTREQSLMVQARTYTAMGFSEI